MSKVLEAVSSIPGAILFVDEAESFFPSRYWEGASGGGVNAAVGNKLLATFLKWMEGMEGASKNSVILASNRAEQLDPALLSRCAGTVTLALPTESQRAAIIKRYAKHLGEEEVAELARESDGLSGRDLLKVCEVCERRHVAEKTRSNETFTPSAPLLFDYRRALEEREESLLGSGDRQGAKGAQPAINRWRKRSGKGSLPMKGHDVSGV